MPDKISMALPDIDEAIQRITYASFCLTMHELGRFVAGTIKKKRDKADNALTRLQTSLVRSCFECQDEFVNFHCDCVFQE